MDLKASLLATAVAFTASSALAVPPQIQPELTVPPSAPSVTATGSQDQLVLAFGAGIYFAAWIDGAGTSIASLKAARLRADGTPIDDPPVTLVSPTANTIEYPAVVFNGSRFVVIWHDRTAGDVVKAMYVDPLGATGASFMCPTSSGPLAAAGAAPQALLVYQTDTVIPNIVAQAFDDSGKVGALITIADGTTTMPAVVRAPTVTAGPSGQFLVAWEQQSSGLNYDVYAARVTVGSSPQVAPIGKINATTIGPLHQQIAAAYDGTNYLVLWADNRSGGLKEVFGRGLSWNSANDPSPVDFKIATGVESVSSPQVTFAGGTFIVAWEAYDPVAGTARLRGQRITVDGTTRTGALVGVTSDLSTLSALPQGILPKDWRASTFASAGAQARLAWYSLENTLTSHDVFTLPVAAGPLGPAASFSPARSPSSSRSPSVAWNGTVFMSVWEDTFSVDTDGGTDLFYQLHDASGVPIGAPKALMVRPGSQRFPVLSALPGGGDFLVAFSDHANNQDYLTAGSDPQSQGQLFIARYRADGTLAAGPIHLGTVARDRFPSIAVDPVDRRWLVSWDFDTNPFRTDEQIGLTVVDALGPSALQALSGQITFPEQVCGSQATFAGGRYLLVMERNCSQYSLTPSQGRAADIDALWVSKDGVPDLTPAGQVTISRTSSSGTRAMPTAAATANGQIAVAWQESFTAPTSGSIFGGIVDSTGTVTPVELVKGATNQTAPAWPRLSAAGSGFVLGFIDESAAAFQARTVRLIATPALHVNPLDGAGAPTAAALLSMAPVIQPLAVPEPLGPSWACGGDGQVLAAFTADQPRGVGQVHTALVGGKNQGEACDPTQNAVGCGDGLCVRDPEKANGGLCCAKPCPGPCQKCTADGCVGTPATDTACGTVRCGALSTACRTFDDAPGCAAFGRCGADNDLQSCTVSHAVNEGGSCTLAGCSKAGSCHAGDCVCGDPQLDYGPLRALPPGCSAVGGSGGDRSGLFALLLLLAALVLLRRRLALLILIGMLTGCADGGILAIDLLFQDGPLQEAARVRLVVKATDQGTTGFSPAPVTHDAALDVTVRNIDIDGDGQLEIVADLGPKFPLKRRTTYLKLTAPAPSMRSVAVSAQAIDRFGNPVAVSAPVNSSLHGGSVSLSITQCPLSGCRGERQLALGDGAPPVIDPRHHPIVALAASPEGSGDGLIAAGVSAYDDDNATVAVGLPNRGRVALLGPAAPPSVALVPGQFAVGEKAGDLFGRAIAIGDVTGDHVPDLIVGAPGVNVSSGRIYVFSAISLNTPLDLASALPPVDGNAGEQLGTSLALADLDGDGVLDVVAGAPDDNAPDGKGAIYGVSFKNKTRTPLGSVPGSTGAHLGRTVAAGGAQIVAGAPGASAVYLLSAHDLTGTPAPRIWTSMLGGGIGGSVALLDLGADGKLDLIAGAPGADALYVTSIPAGRPPTDGDVIATVRATTSGAHLGAALGRVQTRFGDSLWAGGRADDPAAGGLGYVLSAGGIAAAGPQLPLGVDGALAAVTATLASARLTVATGAVLVNQGPLLLVFGDDQGNVWVSPYGGAQ